MIIKKTLEEKIMNIFYKINFLLLKKKEETAQSIELKTLFQNRSMFQLIMDTK